MNYREARSFIQNIQSGARIKPGLDMIRKLLQHMGNPQDCLCYIHIAGTNGKGSVGSFISESLEKAGYRVGRYVSPAIFGECENICRMAGAHTVFLSEEEFAEIICEMVPFLDAAKRQGDPVPTVFEIETAVAFAAFYRWNCDVVVLEAGMGGRLDATNVVRNVCCSVITPVSMDHMKFLGNTVEDIAMEKAGIIKNGVPVVTCQHDAGAEQCIRMVCGERKAEFHKVDMENIRILETSLAGSRFDYGGFQSVEIALAGTYQVENACLALECLRVLKNRFPVKDIHAGLLETQWPGRFQVIPGEPPAVLDGAHNPDGIRALLESVTELFPTEKKIGIMGVFADKDYPEMCRRLAAVFEKVYTVRPPSNRGLEAETLAMELAGCGILSRGCRSLGQAVSLAKAEWEKEHILICVFGSLSLLPEASRLIC